MLHNGCVVVNICLGKEPGESVLFVVKFTGFTGVMCPHVS